MFTMTMSDNSILSKSIDFKLIEPCIDPIMTVEGIDDQIIELGHFMTLDLASIFYSSNTSEYP